MLVWFFAGEETTEVMAKAKKASPGNETKSRPILVGLCEMQHYSMSLPWSCCSQNLNRHLVGQSAPYWCRLLAFWGIIDYSIGQSAISRLHSRLPSLLHLALIPSVWFVIIINRPKSNGGYAVFGVWPNVGLVDYNKVRWTEIFEVTGVSYQELIWPSLLIYCALFRWFNVGCNHYSDVSFLWCPFQLHWNSVIKKR